MRLVEDVPHTPGRARSSAVGQRKLPKCFYEKGRQGGPDG